MRRDKFFTRGDFCAVLKIFTALLISVALVVIGCGAFNEGDRFVVGYDEFAPMGFHDESGELVGFDIDLVSGKYVVDAKSIMGIFSLDLSKPIDLSIHAEENLDEILEVPGVDAIVAAAARVKSPPTDTFRRYTSESLFAGCVHFPPLTMQSSEIEKSGNAPLA